MIGLILGTLVVAAACAASAGIACVITGVVVGGITSAATAGAEADEAGIKGTARDKHVLKNAAFGAISGGAGSTASMLARNAIGTISKSAAKTSITKKSSNQELPRFLN